jgi:hypothetical protein
MNGDVALRNDNRSTIDDGLLYETRAVCLGTCECDKYEPGLHRTAIGGDAGNAAHIARRVAGQKVG